MGDLICYVSGEASNGGLGVGIRCDKVLVFGANTGGSGGGKRCGSVQ